MGIRKSDPRQRHPIRQQRVPAISARLPNLCLSPAPIIHAAPNQCGQRWFRWQSSTTPRSERAGKLRSTLRLRLLTGQAKSRPESKPKQVPVPDGMLLRFARRIENPAPKTLPQERFGERRYVQISPCVTAYNETPCRNATSVWMK